MPENVRFVKDVIYVTLFSPALAMAKLVWGGVFTEKHLWANILKLCPMAPNREKLRVS